ncbi:MAG: hypothetical protein GKB99_00735 [Methanocellales archaeon]|nr:hypothetical protein [Methanocellales archaeon]
MNLRYALRHQSGSPNCSIDRTFSIKVYFPERPAKSNKLLKTQRNPIFIAKEYDHMIKSGRVKSEANLARQIGISRVRVNQFISLLKLAPEVIQKIEEIGDPMPKRYITERKLRALVKIPNEKQKAIIEGSLGK